VTAELLVLYQVDSQSPIKYFVLEVVDFNAYRINLRVLYYRHHELLCAIDMRRQLHWLPIRQRIVISRVSTLTRDIDIAILSVRPSVRLSVRNVPVSDENGLTYCNNFFSPYGRPIILVLPASNIFTKFRRGHPCGGAKYRWGTKISRFSTNKSLYLANDIATVTMEGK